MGGCIGITRSRSGPIEDSSGTVSRPNSGRSSDHSGPVAVDVRLLCDVVAKINENIGVCFRRSAEESIPLSRNDSVEVRRAFDGRPVAE